MNDRQHVLCAEGTALVRAAQELRLRGVVFGFDRAPPTEADYAEIRALGFNVVTLPFSYRPFYGADASEAARAGFWTWVDRHVALARRHGIRQVPNVGLGLRPQPCLPGAGAGRAAVARGRHRHVRAGGADWNLVAYRDEYFGIAAHTDAKALLTELVSPQ